MKFKYNNRLLFAGIKVLLIDGGSRQVLPLIKGFNKLGCEVFVYCGSKLDVGYVYKYTNHKILGIVDFADEEKTYNAIFDVISKNKFDLVVPMIDFFSTILSKHKEQLSVYTTVYVEDWERYQFAFDKLKTMFLCMNNGVPCPKTLFFDNINQLKLNQDLKFPLVIKPNSSCGAKGFNIVHNKEELFEIFTKTTNKFGPSLVQEYIEQTGKQYQVELLMDSHGECKMFVLMEKVRWYPLDGGSSTLNISIHDETIKYHCIKLMKILNWRGYASIDLIQDPTDNITKIMEINPRINGTVKICFQLGIDVSKLILQDALGYQIANCDDYKDGLRLRYFHMDCLWFLASKKRFKTKPSWFSNKKTVDEIFMWEDLRPFFCYSIQAISKLKKDKKNREV